MAFQVSSEESFDAPVKGRSTPTSRVWPEPVLLVPPPPHAPDASATMAIAPITVIRLFIYFLSLLCPVGGDRRTRERNRVRRPLVRRRTNQSTRDGLAGLRVSRRLSPGSRGNATNVPAR